MARGRMLNVSVCASLKFHNLSDDTARLIATWTISYLDFRGVFYADPSMVKSMVLPRRTDISIEKVEQTLDEMVRVGLIFRFHHNGDVWQCWPNFADNQVGLRPEKERTGYPDPTVCTAEPIRKHSGKIPERIRKKDGVTEQNRTEEKRTEKNSAPVARAPNPNSHPAIQVYQDVAHLYPKGIWKQKVIDSVGDEASNLGSWREVCEAYVGLGWNPKNVKTMLEFFERDEVPGVAATNRRGTGSDGRKLDVDGQPIRVWRDVHVELETEIDNAEPGS